MNTNEQAPECCPFCGAESRPMEEDEWPMFDCRTRWSPHMGRIRQTLKCATAERERLTNELETCRQRSAEKDLRIEDLKNRLKLAQDDLSVRIKEVEKLESEWSGWEPLQKEWFGDKYAAMQPWDAVRARIEDTEARIKLLEEAGDDLLRDNKSPANISKWFGARNDAL